MVFARREMKNTSKLALHWVKAMGGAQSSEAAPRRRGVRYFRYDNKLQDAPRALFQNPFTNL